ncbi:MAG: glycosyltransferase N-terminal domain-containing protein [Candidatus Caenarcaniphilales bacterium]|nr:glycosyltransferase N-terminal domain-containing protein [Candidatus Caenarcaniphilales bacterium]
MFWLFLYRAVITAFFITFLPVIIVTCLCVEKWKYGLEQKLGLIDTSSIYKVRGANFSQIIDEMKDGSIDELSKYKSIKNIWLHAVSFGEVKTIEPLVYELQKTFPQSSICLSTGTKTGQDLAQKLFTDKSTNDKLQKECFVFYCPFDFYFAVKNWFTVIKPSLLIIAETEIWPELIHQARVNNVQTFIVNARLTDSSVKKYNILKPLMSELMRCVDTIFVQSKVNLERFISIGAQSEQLKVIDNLKFDSTQKSSEDEVNALRKELNLQNESFVIIAGSTHKGEEELACSVFKSIVKNFPERDLRMIIAPRHLERLSEVKEICLTHSLEFLTRKDMLQTSLNENPFNSFGKSQILLLDTLGELTKFYGISNIAMLGGTWAKVGGHNPLEPIVYGVPVVVGPHTFKIDELLSQLSDFISVQKTESEVRDFVTNYLVENPNSVSMKRLALQENSVSKFICSHLISSVSNY